MSHELHDFEWHFLYFLAWAKKKDFYDLGWKVGGLGEKRFVSTATELAWEAYWLGVEHPRSIGDMP